ncbi:hypothetical protein HYQ46_010233 [Verticillium longisporum]|nr:hypothetical protein HYQ46_010233 [Verticillium longisporum]
MSRVPAIHGRPVALDEVAQFSRMAWTNEAYPLLANRPSRLPQPDQAYTCAEYTTLPGTSSLTGRPATPRRSLPDSVPPTTMSQSGFILSSLLPALSAAAAHLLHGMVPQTPRTSFRRSAPMTSGLATNRAMTASQFRIQPSSPHVREGCRYGLEHVEGALAREVRVRGHDARVDDGVGRHDFVGVGEPHAVEAEGADGGGNVAAVADVEAAGHEELVRGAVPVDREELETAAFGVDNVAAPRGQGKLVRRNVVFGGERCQRDLGEEAGCWVGDPGNIDGGLCAPEMVDVRSDQQEGDDEKHVASEKPRNSPYDAGCVACQSTSKW